MHAFESQFITTLGFLQVSFTHSTHSASAADCDRLGLAAAHSERILP